MEVDVRIAAPLLGWLASGLAAVALSPRSRTAQALLGAGVLLLGSWVCEGVAAGRPSGSTSTAVVTVTSDLMHLGALTAIVAVLCTYPDGRLEGRWAPRAVRIMATLAVLGPLAQLVGSPELLIGGDSAAATSNPLAQDWLAPLGEAGRLVVTTEPTWLLLGVGLLVVRVLHAEGARRRELLLPLGGIALLAVMLTLVVLSYVLGVGDGVSTIAFLVALGVFPMALLMGIVRRTRHLAGDLAASRARLVAAEDEARRVIERDLHDGVQQQLMALLSLAELAGRQLNRDPQQAAATLADVRLQAQSAIEELRELVSGIRPPVLADSGVVAALETRLARLPTSVEVDADAVRGRRWPAGIESAAYFVACEAVTNALKHAPGAGVRVSLSGTAERLVVEVVDDGPGIADTTGGTGLAGLRDRVDSWGGQLVVAAGSQGGTSVRAELPAGAAP